MASRSFPTIVLLAVILMGHVLCQSDDNFVFHSPTPPTDSRLMAMLANGYIGGVVGNGTWFAAGVFEGNITSPVHRARIPAPASLYIPPVSLSIPGSLTLNASQVLSNYHIVDTTMDVQKAIYTIKAVLSVNQPVSNCYGSGLKEKTSEDAGCVGCIEFEEKFYIHRTRRSLIVTDLQINAIFPSPNTCEKISIVLNTTMGAPSADVGFKQKETGGISTPTGLMKVYQSLGSTFYTERGAQPVSVGVCTNSLPDGTFSFDPTTSPNNTVLLFTTIRSSLDSPNPYAQSLHDLADAMEDYENLESEHVDAWSKLWLAAIEVVGDDYLQKSIYASMYGLFSSARDDWPWSVQPEGLSVSDVYFGHTFWDADFWMYPPLLMFHPNLARRSVLDYRYSHIQGALDTAIAFNFSGAMFPWESAFTGHEVCFDLAADCWIEYHIGGDVVLAHKQYWQMTKDLQWLRDFCWPVVSKVADFWLSLFVPSSSPSECADGLFPQGRSSCLVMNNTRCVDEYANHVNNCVFNNAIAQVSLEFAIEVAKLLNISQSASVPLSKWSEAARNIKIPFDHDLQIHLEYDGYNGGTIKQADTTLLGFPLQFPMSKKVRANDINYYAPRTDPNGPAMTWSMYTIDYLELNETQQAAQSFNKSYQDNIHTPYFVWWETLTGGAPNFITGAGGFIQSLLFGYASIRLQNDGLSVEAPLLPPNVDLINFKTLWYRGNAFSLSYDANEVHIATRVVSPTACLSIRLADGSVIPLSDTINNFPLQSFQIFVNPSISCF